MYFFIFSVAFVITFLLTPSVRSVAVKLGVIDRRTYGIFPEKAIAKLGGIAIYCGFFGGIVVLRVLNRSFFSAYPDFSSIIFSSGVIVLLGIYDDFHNCSAFLKLAVEILLSVIVLQPVLVSNTMSVPFFGHVEFGNFAFFILVFWIVGVTNAINFIDGLDGLACGIAGIAAFFLAFHGFLTNDIVTLVTALSLCGACSAFLFYNHHPAQIFMGDTGSLFLGFILAVLGIQKQNDSSSGSSLFFFTFCLLAVPIVDTGLAIIRRILRKQNILKGDYSHLHHFCIKKGWKHSRTALFFYGITIGMGVLTLWMRFSKIIQN